MFAVNCELQRSHTPSRDGLVLTMRSLRIARPQVCRPDEPIAIPVDFEWPHYRFYSALDNRAESRQSRAYINRSMSPGRQSLN